MMTSMNPAADRLATIERELEAQRDEAGEDYVKRGTIAYFDRPWLADNLCLLIRLARDAHTVTAITVAELNYLTDRGYVTADGKLTGRGIDRMTAAAARRAEVAR